MLGDPRSRRDLFRLAGLATAGGSALYLAACGDDEGPSGRGASGIGEDIRVLNHTLDLEHAVIAAYKVGAKLLRGDVLELGRRILAQEEEHAERLSRLVTRLGGTPREPMSIDEYIPQFPRLRDQADVLTFTVDLENALVAAYGIAIPRLSAPGLRRTAAAISTNEAEHLSLLLDGLGKPPVPEAFVTGKQ